MAIVTEMQVLGRKDAESLGHNSFLRGLESGTDYVVKFDSSMHYPWKLIDLRTRSPWSHWSTREQMVAELSRMYMRPSNPC